MILKFEIGLKSSLYPNDLELKKDFYYIKVILLLFAEVVVRGLGNKYQYLFLLDLLFYFIFQKPTNMF